MLSGGWKRDEIDTYTWMMSTPPVRRLCEPKEQEILRKRIKRSAEQGRNTDKSHIPYS